MACWLPGSVPGSVSSRIMSPRVRVRSSIFRMLIALVISDTSPELLLGGSVARWSVSSIPTARQAAMMMEERLEWEVCAWVVWVPLSPGDALLAQGAVEFPGGPGVQG